MHARKTLVPGAPVLRHARPSNILFSSHSSNHSTVGPFARLFLPPIFPRIHCPYKGEKNNLECHYTLHGPRFRDGFY